MNTPRSGVHVSTDFLIGVIVAALILFYWPAPLRYQYTYHKDGMLRTDRITGDVKVLEDGKYETSVKGMSGDELIKRR